MPPSYYQTGHTHLELASSPCQLPTNLILSSSSIQLSGAPTNEVSSGICSFLPTSLVAHDTLQDSDNLPKALDTTGTTNENIDGENQRIVSPALSSSSLYLGSISTSFRQIKVSVATFSCARSFLTLSQGDTSDPATEGQPENHNTVAASPRSLGSPFRCAPADVAAGENIAGPQCESEPKADEIGTLLSIVSLPASFSILLTIPHRH